MAYPMEVFDPRVLLAWLLAGVVATLFLGDAGLGAGAILATVWLGRRRAGRAWLALMRGLLPLALVIVLLEVLWGDPNRGTRAALRVLVLGSIALGFTRRAGAGGMMAALRALRVPYQVVFVLLAGAGFIPAIREDLAQLRTAALLRGIRLDGPPWQQLAGWRLLLVPLIVATIRRGLTLGEAMEARAFGAARHRTVRHALRWRAADSLALAGIVLFLLVTIAAEVLHSR